MPQPSNPLHRPPPLDEIYLDAGAVDQPVPSPPYRRVASTSHVVLPDQDSPAYRSRTELDYADMPEDPPPHERRHEKEGGEKGKHPAAVHYPSDVRSPASAPVPPRFDTFQTVSSSRASSLAGTDDEDDDDDYDWSGEEDLVDEEAKFERVMGVGKKKQRNCFVRIISLLFSTLIGSIIVSGLILTPALVVRFYWYNPNPTDERRYIKDNIEAWLFWASAQMLISWFLALIVDIIPHIVRMIISVVWGHVSEYVKSRLELYTSVKDTIKPLLYAASGWVSWVVLFHNIYKLYDPDAEDNSRASYAPRVYQVIEFLFFFILVLCAQRMLSHFIAFSFHATAYKERLASVTEALQVIEKLRLHRPKKQRHAHRSSYGFGRAFGGLTPGVERTEFFSSWANTPAHSRPGTPDGGHEADTEDRDATLVNKNRKGKERTSWFSRSKNATLVDTHSEPASPTDHRYPPSPNPPPSATPLRKEVRASQSDDEDAAAMVHSAAKALKTAILHDARGIRGSGDDELAGLMWNVTSAHEAKRLARSIYMAFRRPGYNYLIAEDFHPAFAKQEEANAAFKVFDKDNNGDLSRAEIKTTVMKVYKERRFLSRSMRDVGEALTTLDHMLLFIAFIILFFISLSIFGVSIESSLTSVYTIGIGLSFIFKNAASNAFDAIMFLFVTHPFDTGDRCFIDDENLIVKKMGLFATTFTRSDGTETYYFNSQLFNKFITNVRRSDKTAENLVMQVSWRTPLEKLDELEKCMNKWLETEHNRWYQPGTSVTLQKIEYMRSLELTIGIPHNANWQDWGLRNARKTAFNAAVNYYCRQLGISTVCEPPLPIEFVDERHRPLATPAGEDESELELAEGEQEPEPEPEHERKEKVTYMGFQPPQETGGLRARRSRGRKAMMRTMGADG